MVAATQNPLRGYAHHFITDCYKKIDVTKKKFLKFIKFLKIELEIDEKKKESKKIIITPVIFAGVILLPINYY